MHALCLYYELRLYIWESHDSRNSINKLIEVRVDQKHLLLGEPECLSELTTCMHASVGNLLQSCMVIQHNMVQMDCLCMHVHT